MYMVHVCCVVAVVMSSSVSLNIPSFLPHTRGDVAPVVSTADTTLPPNTPMSHKVKPSGSTIPKVQPKENKNLRPKLVINPEKHLYKLEQENKNKGDLMSWVKRKLSQEKDADTSLIAKQSRSDSLKKIAIMVIYYH